MANLDDVVGVLRAAGVTVHETPGWITAGYAGQDLDGIRGILWHHTATGRSAFLKDPAPTVGLCKNGRSDLPGPLCNMVFDRNGEIWMIATGVANHAGRGTAPGIPKDMGNHWLIGIEMESSGVAPWDWTEAQLRMAPIVGAALERYYLTGVPEDQRLQLGHMEYSSEGKIDPAGWPGGMDGLRASINKALTVTIAAQGGTVTPAPATPTPSTEEDEDDMTPTITLIDDGAGKLWATQDFVTKWHVPDSTWVTHYQNVEKWGWLKLRRDSKDNIIHKMPAFGAEVAAPAAPVKAA